MKTHRSPTRELTGTALWLQIVILHHGFRKKKKKECKQICPAWGLICFWNLNGSCCSHGYLLQTLAGLLILAPETVGAAQVEKHHGPSWCHAAGVTQGSLLPCCAHAHTHTKTITVVFWMKFFFCRAVTNCRLLNCKSTSDCSEKSIFYFSKLVDFLNQDFQDRLSCCFQLMWCKHFQLKGSR